MDQRDQEYGVFHISCTLITRKGKERKGKERRGSGAKPLETGTEIVFGVLEADVSRVLGGPLAPRPTATVKDDQIVPFPLFWISGPSDQRQTVQETVQHMTGRSNLFEVELFLKLFFSFDLEGAGKTSDWCLSPCKHRTTLDQIGSHRIASDRTRSDRVLFWVENGFKAGSD